jgi:hypothetical protein
MFSILRTFIRTDSSKPWVTISDNTIVIGNFTTEEVTTTIQPFMDLIKSLPGLLAKSEVFNEYETFTLYEFNSAENRDTALDILFNKPNAVVLKAVNLVESKRAVLNIPIYKKILTTT